MKVMLRKYGNSTVLVLPPGLVKELGLKEGQTMTLDSAGGGSLTLAPKRRHRLADLLAQCDAKAPPPVYLALWDAARPAGHEV